MTTALATQQDTSSAIENVLVNGDLSRLSPDQRLSYYQRLCASLGLNPLTKPFAYINLSGKLVLYALKDATEQLRKIHGVSILELTSTRLEDVFVVTAKAQDKTGRLDAATGAVPIGNAKGEALANMLMKAETKAKRRVTLSICGLGMLDETELETIPRGVAAPPEMVVDTTTGAEVPAAERPPAPAGYCYLDAYSLSNGWHDITVRNWDLKGGAMRFSTKLDIGYVAGDAFQRGIPVKMTYKPKPNGKGEAYLNTVETWKPPAKEPKGETELSDSIHASEIF